MKSGGVRSVKSGNVNSVKRGSAMGGSAKSCNDLLNSGIFSHEEASADVATH